MGSEIGYWIIADTGTDGLRLLQDFEIKNKLPEIHYSIQDKSLGG